MSGSKGVIPEHFRVDVVIPVLNEESTIGNTIIEFAEEIPQARFVICDNGSSDKTVEVALEALLSVGAKYHFLSVSTRGKGNAIRAGFSEVDADAVVMVDGDETYPAVHVHALLDPIFRSEAAMVVGNRHANGGYVDGSPRRFHNLGNKLVQRIVNLLYASDLQDILSGFRAFSGDFVRTYPVMIEGFTLETDLTLHALDNRLPIREVPITYRERPEGSLSKLNTFADGIGIIRAIFTACRHSRPFMFFGLLSLLLVIVGGLAAVQVVYDWITYQYIYHVPLAILAAGAMTAALLSFATAMILDTQVREARRAFALHWLLVREMYLLDRGRGVCECDRPRGG